MSAFNSDFSEEDATASGILEIIPEKLVSFFENIRNTTQGGIVMAMENVKKGIDNTFESCFAEDMNVLGGAKSFSDLIGKTVQIILSERPSGDQDEYVYYGRVLSVVLKIFDWEKYKTNVFDPEIITTVGKISPRWYSESWQFSMSGKTKDAEVVFL